MRAPQLRTAACAGFALGLLLGATSPVFAQAWVPPKGEATVSFIAQDTLVMHHYSTNQRLDGGPIRSRSMTVDLSYGLTDKIVVSFSLPYVSSQYGGAKPHQDIPTENGQYHGTLQ